MNGAAEPSAGASSGGKESAAIKALLRSLPYGAGSVDRQLLAAQRLVTPETRGLLYAGTPAPPRSIPGSRPQLDAIVEEVAGRQREVFGKLVALMRWCSRIPRDFPSSEASTARGFYGDFGAFRWGGDEETVIAKGSPWPQELARVLASLAQLAGIPARLVFLYRTAFLGSNGVERNSPETRRAEMLAANMRTIEMHSVVEAWAAGAWVVFDPCANRFYPWPHHGYASALALQQQPRLVDQAPEHGRIRYVDSAFYRSFGIASYPIEDRGQYGYELQAARPQDLLMLRRTAEVFAD